MGLGEEVYKVMVEVSLLQIEAQRIDPLNILYSNEVTRMLDEGKQLHKKAKDIDELIGISRFRGVPQHRIDDIRREIDIILNNVKFLKHNMDIECEYRIRMQNPQASVYQSTYSSSECQSTVSYESSPSSASSTSHSSNSHYYPTPISFSNCSRRSGSSVDQQKQYPSAFTPSPDKDSSSEASYNPLTFTP